MLRTSDRPSARTTPSPAQLQADTERKSRRKHARLRAMKQPRRPDFNTIIARPRARTRQNLLEHQRAVGTAKAEVVLHGKVDLHRTATLAQ
jgi:hypothetical protein